MINRAVTISVTANDSDPDGHPVSVLSIKEGPAAGTVTIVSASQVRYTPSAQFAGTDRFVYEIHDGRRGFATAAVSVLVKNQAPVAGADSFAMSGSTVKLIPVLANDSDPEGASIRITAVTRAPAHGSATVEPFGGIRYQPAACYVGSDTLEYEIQDSAGAAARATVTITIANDHKPFAADDAITATPAR